MTKKNHLCPFFPVFFPTELLTVKNATLETAGVQLRLSISDAPNTIVTHVGGTVNGEPVMSQALTMNMTPEVASNDVLMNVQNLAGNKGSVTRSFMGVMAMPLTHFG